MRRGMPYPYRTPPADFAPPFNYGPPANFYPPTPIQHRPGVDPYLVTTPGTPVPQQQQPRQAAPQEVQRTDYADLYAAQVRHQQAQYPFAPHGFGGNAGYGAGASGEYNKNRDSVWDAAYGRDAVGAPALASPAPFNRHDGPVEVLRGSAWLLDPVVARLGFAIRHDVVKSHANTIETLIAILRSFEAYQVTQFAAYQLAHSFRYARKNGYVDKEYVIHWLYLADPSPKALEAIKDHAEKGIWTPFLTAMTKPMTNKQTPSKQPPKEQRRSLTEGPSNQEVHPNSAKNTSRKDQEDGNDAGSNSGDGNVGGSSSGESTTEDLSFSGPIPLTAISSATWTAARNNPLHLMGSPRLVSLKVHLLSETGALERILALVKEQAPLHRKEMAAVMGPPPPPPPPPPPLHPPGEETDGEESEDTSQTEKEPIFSSIPDISSLPNPKSVSASPPFEKWPTRITFKLPLSNIEEGTYEYKTEGFKIKPPKPREGKNPQKSRMSVLWFMDMDEDGRSLIEIRGRRGYGTVDQSSPDLHPFTFKLLSRPELPPDSEIMCMIEKMSEGKPIAYIRIISVQQGAQQRLPDSSVAKLGFKYVVENIFKEGNRIYPEKIVPIYVEIQDDRRKKQKLNKPSPEDMGKAVEKLLKMIHKTDHTESDEENDSDESKDGSGKLNKSSLEIEIETAKKRLDGAVSEKAACSQAMEEHLKKIHEAEQTLSNAKQEKEKAAEPTTEQDEAIFIAQQNLNELESKRMTLAAELTTANVIHYGVEIALKRLEKDFTDVPTKRKKLDKSHKTTSNEHDNE